MKTTKGIFLSDIHCPDNINLTPIFNYIKDLKPDHIILGGDIVDAKGMHNSQSLRADQIDLAWYDRDVKLIHDLLTKLHKLSPKAKIVFLAGNHEERWDRIVEKYPKVFSKTVNLKRDSIPKGLDVKWIPYNTYDSVYTLGNTLFVHGQAYPNNHAVKYAREHSPYNIVYGHLHHFQAYTDRKEVTVCKPNYAVTPGCLCTVKPEWKKGAPNQWVNGFLSFALDGKVVIPTVHLIEKGKFYVGAKEYK